MKMYVRELSHLFHLHLFSDGHWMKWATEIVIKENVILHLFCLDSVLTHALSYIYCNDF